MNASISNVTDNIKRKWSSTFSDNKDVLIIILSILLILSIIGVHVFHWILDAIERLVDRVIELLVTLARGVSYSTGEVINISSDTISDVAKTTIDLGNGAVKDVGNVLKSGAYGNYVTPPVMVHGRLPVFARQPADTKAPKPKKTKAPDEEASEEDEDEDEDAEEKDKESMQTRLSPYVFTKPMGYSEVNPSYSRF